MKHIVIYISVIILVISSCSPNHYDINYQGENNYKSFYIVDTIIIKNPVIIRSKKFGGTFVLERVKLNEYQNNIEFFLSPDVFILGFDLYRDLNLEDIKKHNYSDYGGCEIRESEIKIKGVEVFEYRTKPIFILGLINTNYYHMKHNSESYFNIPIKHSKVTYHKLVYPLCD